jgi:hypothetical protein
MLRRIGQELLHHIPFTAAGAFTGILAMILISLLHVRADLSESLFYIFHPLHLLFSAIVTTALFRKHKKSPFWITVPICFLGPIIIGTLSDAIIPYIEGSAIHISIAFELPFIQTANMPFIGIPEWIVVNGAVFIGIAIGYLNPGTKIPHTSHILLSTWASLLYFTSFGTADWLPMWWILFFLLFITVWIPCVFSDIVFPILWVGREHAHEHEHEHWDASQHQ